MTRITLTFDNGPFPGGTERILAALADRELPATFFMVGDRLAAPGGRELAEAVKRAGHTIGNHTMSHGEPLGSSGDPARVEAEIAGAQALLGDLADQPPLFRPNGHGSLGPHLLSEAAVAYLTSRQYTVVTWNAVPRDWEPPSDGWVARAHALIDQHDWTVLVLHDHHPEAIDHLPAFLDSILAATGNLEVRRDFPATCVPIRHGRPRPGLEILTTPARGDTAHATGS